MKRIKILLIILSALSIFGVKAQSNFSRNWFLEVKGGASAFFGEPAVRGSFSDKVTPALQVGLGKWFTPSVGARVCFQGLQFMGAPGDEKEENDKMRYQYYHADFMYNILGTLNQNDMGLSKWDLVPFLGIGIIHNDNCGRRIDCHGRDQSDCNRPLAFSYGLQAGYLLNNHLHLIAEFSGMTTKQYVDCRGKENKFGDTLLCFTIGLSVTLGNTGW